MDSTHDLTSALPPQPRPSEPHTVLLGRFGLRAGWSIVLLIVLFGLFDASLRVGALTAAGHWKQAKAEQQAAAAAKKAGKPPADLSVKDATITESIDFFSLLLASFCLARIERRSLPVYGINRANAFDVLPGALCGVASLSLLVGLLRAFHLLVFDTRLLHGSAIALYGLRWLLAFLFVGLFEEYLSRGFLQFTLMRGLFGLAEKISDTHTRLVAFTLAAFFMSCFFSAGHLGNARENPMGIVMTFLAAVLFSYALWRTGSLWWAIGFHITWDWAQSFLWGTPDSGQISAGRLFQTHPIGSNLLSGGIDGPEGSLLVIPTLLLVALVLRFTTRQAPQPPLEPKSLPAHTTLGL
jgi:membrane protease YdiL (CAAX protease family)